LNHLVHAGATVCERSKVWLLTHVGLEKKAFSRVAFVPPIPLEVEVPTSDFGFFFSHIENPCYAWKVTKIGYQN